jgi:hypothetical protein
VRAARYQVLVEHGDAQVLHVHVGDSEGVDVVIPCGRQCAELRGRSLIFLALQPQYNVPAAVAANTTSSEPPCSLV